ncbi:MAG: DNA primase [Bacteroidales bacterium]|nr:DNA primase [Bacteroidales bacterium]
MIPKETIDKIFDAVRIDEVVSDFLPLKKRGINLLGLCPFHNEKTPSFTVSPAKGIFKCFGCGESGNSVHFVMKHENMTYPEALRYLASKYGIEVIEEKQTDEDLQKQAEKDSLMNVVSFAQNYFHKTLLEHEEGQAIGLQYFYERGISDYLIEKFQLGYSLESWDALQRVALENGYKKDQLLQSGLIVETEDHKIYDRFRGRVIFPIHNITGRPIAFGGRILDSSKSKAKYVNSPESEIYHKSDVLYGIHLARTAIVKETNCYLVEGYTDVISLHGAGVENVVASSGTSLTTGQIKLLKRYTSLITILYDGDAAGLKAAFRGIDMIIEEGLNVRLVLFPQGEDPDSFARKNTSAELQNFLKENTKDFILFKSELLSQEAGNDPLKKAAMIKDIVGSIALVPENINRLLFIRQASEIVNIEEQILVNEVNKIRRGKFFKGAAQDDSPPIAPPSPKQSQQPELLKDNRNLYEREVIRVLLNYAKLEFQPGLSKIPSMTNFDLEVKYPVAHFIIGSLLEDDIKIISDKSLEQIFQEYKEALPQDSVPSEQYFTNHPDENIRQTAIDLITSPYELHQWSRVNIDVTKEDYPMVLSRLVIASVFALKTKIVDLLLKDLLESQKTETDPQQVTNIQKNYMVLITVRNKIATELGRVVLP